MRIVSRSTTLGSMAEGNTEKGVEYVCRMSKTEKNASDASRVIPYWLNYRLNFLG